MKISEQDVRESLTLWRQNVPPDFRGLLDAKDASTEADLEKLILAGTLVYFAGQYFDPITGKVIPFTEVRNALESVIEATDSKMQANTTRMMNGEVSRDKWEEDMQRDIALLIILASITAHGGLAQMNPADWAAAAVRITTQYKFLSAFAGELAAMPLLQDGRILSRVSLYAEAGRAEFEAMRTEINKREGWQEERRILEEGANHCEGCTDQAELEWQPIGTLDPIGDEECGNNCKCTKQYRRKVPGGWMVTDG